MLSSYFVNPESHKRRRHHHGYGNSSSGSDSGDEKKTHSLSLSTSKQRVEKLLPRLRPPPPPQPKAHNGKGETKRLPWGPIPKVLEPGAPAEDATAEALHDSNPENWLPMEIVWDPDCDALAEMFAETRLNERQDMMLPSREECATEAYALTRRAAGEELWDLMIQALDSLGLTRNAYQKQFHEASMQAMAYFIYGAKDYPRLSAKLMREKFLTKIMQAILAVTPRQYGKTTMVGMIVAVFLMFIPGIRIAVFSTGKRASENITDVILGFVYLLDEGKGKNRVISKNQEKIYIAAHASPNGKYNRAEDGLDKSTSVLLSLPANENGTRGFVAHVIILEEAAYMKHSLFKKTVVPALSVNNRVVLAISTPDDENNYYSKLLDAKTPDGKPIFHTIRVGLACQDCVNAGIAHECTHSLTQGPEWQSIRRRQNVAGILADDMDTYARETLGMIVTSSRYAFQPQWITEWTKRPKHVFSTSVGVIHCSIDPSGGGDQSNWAMVSMAFDAGREVVRFLFLFFTFEKMPQPDAARKISITMKCFLVLLVNFDCTRSNTAEIDIEVGCQHEIKHTDICKPRRLQFKSR